MPLVQLVQERGSSQKGQVIHMRGKWKSIGGDACLVLVMPSGIHSHCVLVEPKAIKMEVCIANYLLYIHR